MQAERAYLQTVIREVHRQIQALENSIEANETNYRNLQRYTVTAKHELDKYEVYNHQQNLQVMDQRSVLGSGLLKKLAYQKESPYFARIDFRYENEEEVETFYLGRYGLADQYGEQRIYDWRAPISSLYYEFGIGKAAYQSLNREYSGETTLKRQFEIFNVEIVFMADGKDGLTDSLLLKELGNATANEMKTIVNTIQADQNTVIRDTVTKNMIIQGVAGSGKTSIALHRIAFLLYQYRETLQAEDVLIVSPNQIFSRYIASVLPELGEDELRQVSLLEIAKWCLDDSVTISQEENPVQTVLNQPHSDIASKLLFLRSAEHQQQLDQALQTRRQKLVAEDLKLAKEVVIVKAELERQLRGLDLPLLQLPQALTKRLARSHESLQTEKQAKKCEQLLKKRLGLRDTWQIYQEIFTVQHRTIPESQLYSFLYLKLKVEGLTPFTAIKHLVIDEMQDYSLLQYAVLAALFPCNKTLCGDVSQSLLPISTNYLTRLSDLLPAAKVVEFHRSYRSSYEIIQYAKQFCGQTKIEAVPRHGSPVVEIVYQDHYQLATSLQTKVREILAQAEEKRWGIICQSEAELALVREILQASPIQVIDDKTNRIQEKIILTTIVYAKGLEFDGVILPKVKRSQLGQVNNSLYTCCTRALHELVVMIEQDGDVVE